MLDFIIRIRCEYVFPAKSIGGKMICISNSRETVELPLADCVSKNNQNPDLRLIPTTTCLAWLRLVQPSPSW